MNDSDSDIVSDLRSELRATLVPYDEARANEMIDRAVDAVDIAELPDLQSATVRTGVRTAHRDARRNWLNRYAHPMAAAASVIAVAAVSAVVVSNSHRGPTHRPAVASAAGPAAHAAPAPTQSPFGLAWRFSVHPVPGYDIKRLEITNRMQAADVTAHGQSKSSGAITVYAPGVLSAAEQPSGIPITVHGRPGVFGMSAGKPALGWRYANGAWAIVTGDWGVQPDTGSYDLAAARAAQQIIADAVDTSASEPFLVDFRLGWLPAGLVYEQGVDVFGPNNSPMVMLGFGDGKPAAPTGKTLFGGSAVTISRQVPASEITPNLTVAGRPAYYDDLGLTVDLADGTQLYIGVEVNHRDTFTKADLIKIATNASVTPQPANRNTWVPASASMPH
ncbi:MAG: hypothetical protein DLM58_06670 [Pseudonocardiales bacterium]|nr:MAG: hypothetical protein DLM58_06670 [Pseudonocardiales bacterium]